MVVFEGIGDSYRTYKGGKQGEAVVVGLSYERIGSAVSPGAWDPWVLPRQARRSWAGGRLPLRHAGGAWYCGARDAA